MENTEMIIKKTRLFTKLAMKAKKHSPEILVVAGVVGTIVSTVLACKATPKVHAVLEKTKRDIQDVHEAKEAGVTQSGESYSEEDSKKDLSIIYVKTGVEIAKLYFPAVLLGVASIAGIFASHNIMRKRNFALAAAYATIDSSFKEYRKRVAERFGEEVEKEIRFNFKAQKVDSVEIDEETGKSKKVKKTVTVGDPNLTSDYAVYFDEKSTGFESSKMHNLFFLKAQQNYFNDILRIRGHVFLNDVYDGIGLPRTPAGQIVGWVKDGNGDGYVDFRILETYKEKETGELEPAILLDFNVDGTIWDKI